MLTDSQWDRYSALLKRLRGLPADQRAAVVRSIRAQQAEDPSVLQYVSVYFRLPPEPDRCRTGERIGHVTLGAQLGSGGMGVVYHAKEDAPLEREVALKLIHPKLILTGQHDTVERFEREIAHLARLEREGIARIYTAGTHTEPDTGETLPFFTMQLVRDGVPLTAYAQEHALTVPERLELFLRVCDAVKAAHQQSIIHRDLKPSNILVDTDGRPFVIDFGLAEIYDPSRNRGEEFISGTPPYLSPEQASTAYGPVDQRSDVYTLGFILYELLAGRRPIEIPPNASWEVLCQEILTARPAALSRYNAECHGDLETIVAKTLAKRPTDRYGSVADLQRTIRDYLDRKLRVTAHRAYFTRTDPRVYAYFINITNLSRDREVEITHVWLATEPDAYAVPPERPLPKRLRPDEAWSTWVEESRVPERLRGETDRETVCRLGRVRLSTGDVYRSEPETTVPGRGTVPGGPVTSYPDEP